MKLVSCKWARKKVVWLVIRKLFCNLTVPQAILTKCRTICYVTIENEIEIAYAVADGHENANR